MALAMLWLGLWQMQVFEDQGNRSAAARAAQPPVPLLDHVGADGAVGDVYGKQVTVSGSYLPGQTQLVVAEDHTVRVLEPLQVEDGRVVPVVRGALGAAADPVPSAPAGPQTVRGVFLPSEPGTDREMEEGMLGSVRLPLIAQRWPQHLLPGFVTLGADAALAQGLSPAQVDLPSGDGSWRNGGYALQWWVFAAFAVAITWRMARAIGGGQGLGRIAAEEDS